MPKNFPDLNDDGKVTRADVLKGRGVPGFKGGKFVQEAIKKPGALRKSLGVKAGEKIPAGKQDYCHHPKPPFRLTVIPNTKQRQK